MLKILLILVFFMPATGSNRTMSVGFQTMEACLSTKDKVMKEIPTSDEVWYVLECVEGTPTNGVRI